MDERNKNAIKRLIADLKKNGVNYQTYDDMLLICRVGLLEDVKCKYEYAYYMDYVKEIALKEVVNDKAHAEVWRNLYWETVTPAGPPVSRRSIATGRKWSSPARNITSHWP